MSVVADTPSTKSAPLDHMALCGAKTNAGRECKRPASKNGRCNLHGGKSLSGPAHPAFKTGHSSKYLYLPPILTARIENMALNIIENLEESIKIQRALETQLHEQVGTGESPDAWQAIRKTLDNIGFGENQISPDMAIGFISAITTGELGEQSLRREIQSVHETQRKLSESVSKIRKETQETYTQEQWNVFFNAVMGVLVRRIADARLLSDITTDFASLAGTAEPKRIGGTVAAASKN